MSALVDFFHYKDHAPKLLFLLFVTLATVVPRMPLDDPWTIGGNLSNSFRKILLVSTASYVLRNLVFGKKSLNGYGESIILSLQAIEGVMLCFLSLLTPYLLLKWLSSRINLGRRSPGQILQPWIVLFAALNSLAVAARIITGNPNYWIFKKLADTLSFFPVMKTLKLYSQVTHCQTRYSGRGSVLSQMVYVAEYFALVMNGLDTSSKIFVFLGVLSSETLKSVELKGMYGTNSYASYSRILCHGILLNVLDEAYIIGISSTSGGTTEDASSPSSSPSHSHTMGTSSGPTVEPIDDEEDGLEDGQAMVPLNRSRRDS